MERRTYSEKFRARVVQQLLAPDGKTASELSREIGVSQSTLSRWRQRATTGSVRAIMSKQPEVTKRESEWSSQEKLEFLVEAMACSDTDLGALLRRRGVHEATYQQWRQAALTGLTGAEKAEKQSRKERREEQRRVRKLEKELRRKDKALAETAALLVLQKKLPSILGGEDESTSLTSD